MVGSSDVIEIEVDVKSLDFCVEDAAVVSSLVVVIPAEVVGAVFIINAAADVAELEVAGVACRALAVIEASGVVDTSVVPADFV